MSYHWTVPLIAAIADLVLAVMVYRRAGTSKVRRLFALLALMLVFWNLHAFVLFYVADASVAFALSRMCRNASLLIAPIITHITILLKERPLRHRSLILWFDYAIFAGFIVANSLDLLISGLTPSAFGYQSVKTPFYNVFTVLVIANFLLAIGNLVHEYKTTSSPQSRQQLRFWLLGALVALPLGLTQMLPTYGIPFYPLGGLANAAWVALVAYAIVRHRLMDIDLALTKGMAYAAVSVGVIAPAFGLTLWLQGRFFHHVDPDFSFAFLAILVGVGLVFPRLQLRVESQIERSFFREKHEYRAALSAFTRSIIRILDRERLLNELAETLVGTLMLDRLGIFLLDEMNHTYSLQHATGPPCLLTNLADDHMLIVAVRQRDAVVLRAELEASPSSTERTAGAEVCRENGWEVCLPLKMTGRLVGLIVLGRKRNSEAFSSGDLELLETLAAQASIAIENAWLYEELRKSQDIIRRADRLSALGTLAAGIAHEVRNPLVAIQTFFQLAPERLHDEEFMTTFLGMTAGEVKRIATLINELLSFARSPSRSLRPVDLNDSLARVVALLDAEARNHQLTLSCTLAIDCVYASADADQLKQVLINLVLNAIQATTPGGSVRVATRLLQHRQQAFGQIEIHDTGVGIPAERIEHIFDPFFTTKDKGTGLGLAIVHQIIAEHGGSISVESKEGQGTSFFIDLPACEPGAARNYPAEDQIDAEPVALEYRHKVAS